MADRSICYCTCDLLLTLLIHTLFEMADGRLAHTGQLSQFFLTELRRQSVFLDSLCKQHQQVVSRSKIRFIYDWFITFYRQKYQ